MLLSEGQLEAGQAEITNGHYGDTCVTATVSQGNSRNMPPSPRPHGACTLARKLGGGQAVRIEGMNLTGMAVQAAKGAVSFTCDFIGCHLDMQMSSDSASLEASKLALCPQRTLRVAVMSSRKLCWSYSL